MPEITVRTAAQRAGQYRVLVEPGLLTRAGSELDRLEGGPEHKLRAAGRGRFVITNSTVWRHWGKTLGAALGPRSFAVVRMPEGEAHKNLAAAERICEELVERGADRGSLLIAFGGGIVGDVAGFVAAAFLRGVEYVQIPTTLLAQIDSSVGGKTGVNLRAGKNLVGAFYHPKLVLADPRVLGTLPGRELRAGLYEAVKCGVIHGAGRGPGLFDFIERHRERLLAKDVEALADLVAQCVEIKAWVVGRDERESGLRRILNFGHTIGHALEAETKYRRYLHGEAVAWGMRAATLIAEQRGMIRARDAARIHALIEGLGPLPALAEIPSRRLAGRLRADKKTRAGVVHFVLPEKIGRVRIVAGVAPAAAARALAVLREKG